MSNIWNTNVVDQDGDINSLKLSGNGTEEFRLVTLREIGHNVLGLDLMLLVDLAQSGQSEFHFVAIPSNHADVEAQRG